MNLQELKKQSPADLISQAEKLGIENPSTLRKQEILFAILKKVAEKEEITGAGVLQLLQDGFGFLRAMESNYLPGPDDIYVSPSQIRKFGLRTGDTVEGPVRAPKEGERYFALLQVSKINFEEPDKSRHKIAFDNLTPLYPNKQITLEVESNKIEEGGDTRLFGICLNLLDHLVGHLHLFPAHGRHRSGTISCETSKTGQRWCRRTCSVLVAFDVVETR